MIDLHYIATANGLKIGFLLEELGLQYHVFPYEMFAGEHLTPAFRRLNPNHKLPVIVDREPSGGGDPVTVFETGAIMLYLAEKTGRLLPSDLRRRTLAQQWLIWQVSGLGPMHGQAHHFIRYAPPGQLYAVERYTKEAKRQLNVLEYRLREAEYLAEEFSIADLAVFPWVQGARLIGFELTSYAAISAWSLKLSQRPAIQKALTVPELKVPEHYIRPRAVLNTEQWSNLFGERMHAATDI